MPLGERLVHAWNAFVGTDELDPFNYGDIGGSLGSRPDRPRLISGAERTIISSIYTRLSIDVASVSLKHVKLDDQERYEETIYSGLNNCLTVEANLDQAGRHFRQDLAMTLFDKGVAAIVPVETNLNPNDTGGYDIKTLRVGEIVSWYPRHVRVNVYNIDKGYRQQIVLDKKYVAIVENPLYPVMNEPNSTLQRLQRKLALLDRMDEEMGSGKLDLIIQLPYVVKSEARKAQAIKRRAEIEFQLRQSQYGIAYTDGTERITQLNRPAENDLLRKVESLKDQLYVELGLTPEVMNGTADEAAMINYNNRTTEPVVSAITEAMRRTFLTKTARTQGQSIIAVRDPFKLVPLGSVAEIADKFTRNEILSSNEVRASLGFKPSKDPKADELHNANMPRVEATGSPPPEKKDEDGDDIW